MSEETIKKMLLGTDEDVILAMHFIFKNLNTNKRGGTYLYEYPVKNRREKDCITLYNNKYMVNTGWHYLVFSKRGNEHYKAMLSQTCDRIIKMED